jgi:trimeric autotransporter adhesin
MLSLRSALPRVSVVFAGIALLGLQGLVHGQAGAGTSACEPSWIPTFGQAPGADDTVSALASFDDGSGPALVVGGSFLKAGGVDCNRIATWDGETWSALGGGMDGPVSALASFDDGTGPALHACGSFTTAGGVAANRIAKWNGSSWSALGDGLNAQALALAVFDDGSGPALYAGGHFTLAGGVPASGIAKWDGASWSALGSGLDAGALALAVFDDGSGPALHAGGSFTEAGGVPASGVAKWDGTSWSALGAGVGIRLGEAVEALAVFDDGSGPALYAGGFFTSAGGMAASSIASWDGSGWSTPGSGVEGLILALTVFDAGGGPVLCAGGSFLAAGGMPASQIAAWDGATWSPLGAGTSATVEALAVVDHGSGAALFAGGSFSAAGDAPALRVAEWDGASWSPLGSGLDGEVHAIAGFDDGSGPALFAGGSFSAAGSVAAKRIVKWDGASWSPLGTGMAGGFAGGAVDALLAFDDGTGSALHAGGNFVTAGGVVVNHIARWDGSSWSPLGSGMTASGIARVQALAVFDDGSGPALYAGGRFATAGGTGVNHVAKWDGSSWSSLGSGMSPFFGVDALTVFDDGSGPALYAGGSFTVAGGTLAHFIAKWDGASWSPLGAGMNGRV